MPSHLPNVTFHFSELNHEGKEDWISRTSIELFAGKKVILFAVPGAFTPTCSKSHLPGYENTYGPFQSKGINDIYCLSVNDAFIMNEWRQALEIEHVQMLPDGNAAFTKAMDMLVARTSQGLGFRSWRYSLYAEDMEIKKIFVEPNKGDNPLGVPLDLSSAEKMLAFLS